MSDFESPNLMVYDYDGTPRSGKGTIVSAISQEHEGVAAEEAGADYRALAFQLLEDGVVETDMPGETVNQIATDLPFSTVADIVARRHEIVDDHGLDTLYSGDVDTVVPHVAAPMGVKDAVRAGFMQRVEAIRDDSAFDTLLIDGRNLGPFVVAQTTGLSLALRTFVTCTPEEAATREMKRISTTARSYEEVVTAIKARTEVDANHPTEPVRPSDDAINYWSKAFSKLTAQQLTYVRDANLPTLEQERRLFMIRHGIGCVAAKSGRQILFDTTCYRAVEHPKTTMLQAADVMFQEAREYAKAKL